VTIAMTPASIWAVFQTRSVAPKIPTNRAEAIAYAKFHVPPESRRGYSMEIIEVDPVSNGGRYIVCFLPPGKSKEDKNAICFLIMDSGYCLTTVFVNK
jgi:hypothetical protein